MAENPDEYLKDYLNQKDYNDNTNLSYEDNRSNDEENKDLGTTKELQYISIDINELPCREFYPAGTSVFVRAAKVSEIQSFSMVDDKNFYDIYEKVNKLVSSCVFIKTPEGQKLPYIHLIDGDRWYLLFAIRELTFQKGNDLYTEVEDTKIPLKRKYFEFHEMDEKLKKYYDKHNGRFVFQTKHLGDIEMAPPTLGLQKSFSDYTVKKVQNKKEVDRSFLKIIPYTLPGRTSITEEGIDKKMQEFKTMEHDMFQFLNGAVQKMKFGIKGLKSIDENGQEVRSQDIFPTGISGLFVQPDAFDDFLI